MLVKDNRKKAPKHRAEPKVKNKSNRLLFGTALGITATLSSLGLATPATETPVQQPSVETASNETTEVSYLPIVRTNLTSDIDAEVQTRVMEAIKGHTVEDVVVPTTGSLTLSRVIVSSEPAPEPTLKEKMSTAVETRSGKASDKSSTYKSGSVAPVGSRISKWVNPVPHSHKTSGYGHRAGIPAAGVPAGMHNGQDLSAPMGTNIRSAFDGEVVHVGFGDFDTHTGGIVVVLHKTAAGSFLTSYNHMKSSGISVKVGDKVRSGDVIAHVASEGRSSGPHLHFSVRKVTGPDVLHDWELVNPVEFMAARGVKL